jgi:hypothetical protein
VSFPPFISCFIPFCAAVPFLEQFGGVLSRRSAPQAGDSPVAPALGLTNNGLRFIGAEPRDHDATPDRRAPVGLLGQPEPRSAAA